MHLRYVEGALIIFKLATTVEVKVVVGTTNAGVRLVRFGTKEPVEVMEYGELDFRRADGLVEYQPPNARNLTKRRDELLNRPLIPDHPHTLMGMMRVEYCWKVREYLREGRPLDECYALAAEEVHRTRRDYWLGRFRDVELVRLSRISDKRRSRSKPVDVPELRQPAASTVETWFRKWEAGERSVQAAIPEYFNCGGQPKKSDPELYGAMRRCIREYYLEKEEGSPAAAWKALQKWMDTRGEDAERITRQGFGQYIRRNFADAEHMRLTEGATKARMTFGAFRRAPEVRYALDEAEIDHCLADIIIVDETSGRRLGRPWITVLFDRATRMILGMHVSFELPSYASVQRCLMQAFWVKDLRGLPLQNPWPCQGVPGKIITDNGKEFLSDNLDDAAKALDFQLEQLPVRSPYLKGKIERFFGTMNAAVFDLEEGKTFSNIMKRKGYCSVEKARMPLDELRWKLLKWVVDDYHVTVHGSLDTAPLVAWVEKQPPEPPQPIESFDGLRRSLGERFTTKIGRNGIKMNNACYWNDRLDTLRQWDVDAVYEGSFDPFDIHVVDLLVPTVDRDRMEWIECVSDRPGATQGVSKFQNRVRRRGLGRRRLKPQEIDQAYLRSMRADEAALAALADGTAKTTAAWAARYALSNGTPFTYMPKLPRPGYLLPDGAGVASPNLVARFHDLVAEAWNGPGPTADAGPEPGRPVQVPRTIDLTPEPAVPDAAAQAGHRPQVGAPAEIAPEPAPTSPRDEEQRRRMDEQLAKRLSKMGVRK